MLSYHCEYHWVMTMFERCIYFNTNALARKLNARWQKAFAKFDLPPSHGYLLRLVLEMPGQSQQDIAEALQLDKSTVARFIGKLETKGLLTRRACEEDQREKVIYPTEKALAMQADLEALGEELYASMCTALGKNNVRQFVTSLRAFSSQL